MTPKIGIDFRKGSCTKSKCYSVLRPKGRAALTLGSRARGRECQGRFFQLPPSSRAVSIWQLGRTDGETEL
ncbi:hypothetical protein FJ567_04065 [Mesorhizobium sp. B2-4-16]|nr:hypothetical protein FJ567_04065 [Mesorhizobium sp. B2-4-16]TPL76429.1 hypothetical protein FJ956_05005 [Mesorhizobium sp. B2-4-3]